MDEDVQLAPLRPDLFEDGLQLPGNRNVERPRDRRSEFVGKRLDVRPRLFVEPGDGEIGASRLERLRTSIGDGLVVRHAYDKRPLSRKNGSEIAVAHQAFPQRI